ncbi:hypothetical protein Lepto7376_2378 [[Leptolyngbya] sp. PCC 7376]|uniref:hypothetical protein n=1 Tax=[Leptolyngbya] sp. PCC 7376 TaxID=111781 RepID=UPI00029F3AE9|nr:hypothetical protein [[Leptolyngbya] sp. PCC 7376]AFY38660.1 hypothetical protein Lepto7376_2378 [[Leptolyngbya] sp. PCC 7376]
MAKAGTNPKNQRSLYEFTLKGQKYLISLKEGIYDSWASIVGYTKITGDIPEGAITVNTDDAIDNMLLLVFVAKYVKGKHPVTGNANTQSGAIFIPRDKVEEAVDPATGLAGKTYNGFPIAKIGQPRKRSYRYA